MLENAQLAGSAWVVVTSTHPQHCFIRTLPKVILVGWDWCSLLYDASVTDTSTSGGGG